MSVQRDYFSNNSESLSPENKHLHLDNTLNIWITPSLAMRHPGNITGTGFIGKKRRVVRRRERILEENLLQSTHNHRGEEHERARQPAKEPLEPLQLPVSWNDPAEI